MPAHAHEDAGREDMAHKDTAPEDTGHQAARRVVRIVRETLGEDAVLGTCLHGSAVLGGLRPTSVQRPGDQ
ncbi:hypothetical protein ACWD5B_20540 [Streptomyces tanashiensis]